MLSDDFIFNFPSLEVTKPNNYKLSEIYWFLFFTSKPNIGYERNDAENYLICLGELSLLDLFWFPNYSDLSFWIYTKALDVTFLFLINPSIGYNVT